MLENLIQPKYKYYDYPFPYHKKIFNYIFMFNLRYWDYTAKKINCHINRIIHINEPSVQRWDFFNDIGIPIQTFA